jgi:hypothetical protein
MKREERRDNGAPRPINFGSLKRSAKLGPTPLQQVLELSAEMWQRATDILDERAYDVFLDCERIKVARESVRQVDRQHRRAA